MRKSRTVMRTRTKSAQKSGTVSQASSGDILATGRRCNVALPVPAGKSRERDPLSSTANPAVIDHAGHHDSEGKSEGAKH